VGGDRAAGGPGPAVTVPAAGDAGGGSPPPPGPGVQPPFAAAPIEGRNARLWLTLGIAGAVAVLCAGVAAVAFGGLLVTGVSAANERAHRAVGDYLDAVLAADWERAHGLRCERDRGEEPLAAFTRRVSGQPRIDSYEMGELQLTQPLELPVRVTYTNGRTGDLRIPLVQNQRTGELEVCGLHG
jgi:hypothetical protein